MARGGGGMSAHGAGQCHPIVRVAATMAPCSRAKVTKIGQPWPTNCNTSGVLNPKICHVIICIAHHFCVSENFDMHSLKQVYFYDDMC